LQFTYRGADLFSNFPASPIFMNFTDLQLIEPLLHALQEEGYTQPTPIQAQAIPPILEGRDLLGCAQTGTGKTAAFTLPMLQMLSATGAAKNNRLPRALILTPTRELAIQIADNLKAYGRHLSIRQTVVFGGVGQQPQVNALRQGIDVLIATPGRLLDLMNQGFIQLSHIEFFVLDEADRMLDMGFVHDVKKVISKLPSQRQSLFFSATMPLEIVQLAGTILKNPQKVTVTPISSTVEIIDQSVCFVEKSQKPLLLVDLLRDPSIDRMLVFTRTKHGADKVCKVLIKNGISSEAIHGNKAQNARQRALTNFKAGTTRVLVATDIAARGIDVDDLACVLNYELPNVPETYVHRIGRTGRAGASGTAIAFCDTEEKPLLRDIEKLIRKSIPVRQHQFTQTTEAQPQASQTDNNNQRRPQASQNAGNRKPSGFNRRRY
jgi:ATP-dependent RNA helicase RhlE